MCVQCLVGVQGLSQSNLPLEYIVFVSYMKRPREVTSSVVAAAVDLVKMVTTLVCANYLAKCWRVWMAAFALLHIMLLLVRTKRAFGCYMSWTRQSQ